MKNILKYGIAFIMFFGVVAFTQDITNASNTEAFACYVYNTDLTTAKWNEIAGHHGFTSYIIIDNEVLGVNDHIITPADYNGNWEDFMNCLGLAKSTYSIIIGDDPGGG